MNLSKLGKWFHDNDFNSWLSMTCIYCGREGLYSEHVIPKSRGGKGNKNIVPTCAGCNAEKGTQTPLEWIGIPNEEIYYGSPRHVEFAKIRFNNRDAK